MRYAWVSKVGMVTLFGVLVLVGSPYTASAGKAVPPAVPRVVDATGKLVGQVIGTSVENEIVVAHVVLNISVPFPVPPIIVQVTGDSIRGSMSLVYAAANCAGQPYYRWNRGPDGVTPVLPTSVFPIVAVANNNVYVVQRHSQHAIPRFTSTWDVVANKCVAIGNNETTFLIVGVADPIFSDLSTEFQQPYRFVYP